MSTNPAAPDAPRSHFQPRPTACGFNHRSQIRSMGGSWRTQVLGIDGAVNQAIPFQLSQLDGQHVLCHARDRAPQGIEALRALAEHPEDLELPLSAEYSYRAPDVVIELGYVIIVWAPLGSMV